MKIQKLKIKSNMMMRIKCKNLKTRIIMNLIIKEGVFKGKSLYIDKVTNIKRLI
jgi:hypothetical protein